MRRLMMILAACMFALPVLAGGYLLAGAWGVNDFRYIGVPMSQLTNGPEPIYEDDLPGIEAFAMALPVEHRLPWLTMRLNRAFGTPDDWNIWGTPTNYALGNVTNLHIECDADPIQRIRELGWTNALVEGEAGT